MVADGLMFRGEPITFNMLVATLRQKCRQKVYSEERKRLLGSKVAARLKNQTLQLPPLRAALLVLVQHNIVKLTVKQSRPSGISSSSSNSSGKVVYRYHLDMTRARMLPRYPRYVEYTKKAVDATSATLVEELLVQGRLRTADAVQKTFESLQSLEAETVDEANDGQQDETLDNNTATTLPTIVESSTTSVTSASNATKTTTLQSVLDAFKRLVQAGFLEQVPRLADEDQANAEGATAEVKEFEFDEPVPEPPTKKVKIDKSEENDRSLYEDEDPVIVASLQGSAYRDFLPRHAVWRVNIHMFHDALRAFALGRLTSERYGHKVQSAGSMISAALKYLANKKHANKKAKNDRDDECNIEEQTFQAADVLRYLPKAVLQLLERKRKAAATVNKSLSVVSQVAKSLQQLSANDSPVCVLEVEVGAKPEDSKFEICVSRMVKYMQERITNRMLVDHHGEIAARIVTILLLNGHLESDSLAESAMVPAKDTREVSSIANVVQIILLFSLNDPLTVHEYVIISSDSPSSLPKQIHRLIYAQSKSATQPFQYDLLVVCR